MPAGRARPILLRVVLLRAIVAAAVALAGLAYLNIPLLTRGMISGGWGDTSIQIAILQNWSNCLSGTGDCFSPNYFFPVRGTLGYNDAYLVSGLLYHGAVWLGLDPFLAYEAVYAVIRLVGFAAVLGLGMRVLRLRFGYALLAALLSLVAVNTVNRVVHTQLLYAAFVPLGLLLLIALLRRLRRIGTAPAGRPGATAVWPAHALLAGLGLLVAAWAVTAFYSLFFFALFAAAATTVLAITDRSGARMVGRALVRHPSLAVTAMAAALPTPIALFVVYGASLKETGGHGWFAAHFPRFSDLLNVGPDNLVWARGIDLYRLLSGRPPALDELATGYPVLLLGGFVATLVWLVARRTSDAAAPIDPERREADGIVFALAAVSAVTMLGVLRYGGGYSPWWLVWWGVPGARAIRVPGRFLLFLTPIVSLVVAYGLAALLDRLRPHRRTVAAAACAGLLLVEQINVRPPYGIVRGTELAFLSSIPPPPPVCRAFAVTVPRHGPSGDPTLDTWYVHSVDAMMVAAMTGLPTVNGMASFVPRGWDLDRPFAADYPARVRAYADRHGLADGLCGLDLKTPRWSTPDA